MLQEVFSLRRFQEERSLKGMRALLAAMGNPLRGTTCVQIAGTNGKGSTAACLQSILHKAGIRTGLFTSPHLNDFRERYRIDGEDVPDRSIFEALPKILHLARQTGFPVLFFEIATALAVHLFADAGIEVAIFEVGLGGELDATTAIETHLSIITSIGYDHCQWLGETLEEIAEQKAGILRPGIPWICGVEKASVLQSIVKKADQVKAGESMLYQENFSLSEGGEFWSGEDELQGIFPGLQGDFQRKNAALAIAGAQLLSKRGFHCSPAAVREGVAEVRWPGRLQRVSVEGKELWLDGAHNVDAAKALKAFCHKNFPGKSIRLLFSCMKDKDFQAFLEILIDDCVAVHLFPLEGPRAISPKAVADWVVAQTESVRCTISYSATKALQEAFALVDKNEILLATGSLFAVGQILHDLPALTRSKMEP